MGKYFIVRSRVVIICSASLMLLATGFCQQTVPPDDPAVLLGYFSLHHALNEAATTNPTLRQDAATMMGISEAEFTLAARIADSVLAQIRSISLGVSAQRLDLATAREVDGRRKAALISGLAALHKQLPASSWETLHRYINVTYRAGLRSQVIPVR